MAVNGRIRKAVVLAHVVTSVGWLGAVVAYVSLDFVAVMSRDVQLVRGAFLAMEVMIQAVIVPLAIASVMIGLITAWCTPWGVLRHYWVLMKLLATAMATVVLLLETPTIRSLADAASTASDPRELNGTLPHSVGGAVVLLLITGLSIFRPKGLTRYGWRKQQEQRRAQVTALTPTAR